MDEQKEIEQVLRYLEQQETDLAEQPTKSPVSVYLDQARFEAELRAFFQGYPVLIGHASKLKEPGSFFTEEVVGVPLLFTHPAKGGPRAFLNVCRHRGTKLVWETEGRGKESFACPYHAWTYHADGRLLGIAHEKTFGEVERGQMGLVPVSLVERFGLLWVSLKENTSLEIPEGLAEELRWLGMEGHVIFPKTYRRRWRFHWKLGIEGGLEAYHFRYAHAKSIAPLFFDNLLIYRNFAPHGRLLLPKRTITTLRDAPQSEWSLRTHANLLYFLFPNAFLLAQPDYTAIVRISPLSIKESEIEITMIIPEAPTSEKAQRHWEKNYELMIGALDEDFTLGERIQETLTSGANTHLTFGRNELGLSLFHQELTKRLLGNPQ